MDRVGSARSVSSLWPRVGVSVSTCGQEPQRCCAIAGRYHDDVTQSSEGGAIQQLLALVGWRVEEVHQDWDASSLVDNQKMREKNVQELPEGFIYVELDP